MRIVFFGSDDFALRHLEKLVAAGHEVMAGVCPPDKARGRGLRVLPPEIKTFSRRHNIEVLQPPDIREESLHNKLRGYESDLFVVIAYGKILPASLLRLPRIFAVNVHGSLLPKYRGAAPINWAIINGETATGVTVIKLNERMDAGDILAQAPAQITDEDTAVTLRMKLADEGSRLLCATVAALEHGEYRLVPQDEAGLSLAPKLTKGLGRIDWERPAKAIHDLARGLLPWPGAYTFYKGRRLKVLDTEVAASAGAGRPGEIVALGPKGFVVAAGQGALLVKMVHPESSRAMTAAEFIAGHAVEAGLRLGQSKIENRE